MIEEKERNAWRRIIETTRDSYQRFERATRHCAAVQEKYLLSLVQLNKRTQFGKQYDFAAIRTVQEYRDRVPIHSYSEFEANVIKMMRGESNILVDAQILAFESTSGSTGGSKWVPYNHNSMLDFKNALWPWLHDLLAAFPGICEGSAYWAISPVVPRDPFTPNGIQIGLDDGQYFGSELIESFQEISVLPGVKNSPDFAAWREATVLALLLEPNLSFVSVWSPTFLTEILQWAVANRDDIFTSLKGHSVNPERLEKISRGLDAGDFGLIWPRLSLVSCWMDGPSRWFANDLANLLPSIKFQGKGLLATEGVVSFPWKSSSVLSIESGFYEFVDQSEGVKLANEVEVGETYRVIMTNNSGLYRYDMNDCVRVEGFYGTTPLIRFVGRAKTSDLCGEKLSEEFVDDVLSELLGSRRGYSHVQACTKPKPHYELLVDVDCSSEIDSKFLETRCESLFNGNPQYRYARALGQLQAVKAIVKKDLFSSYVNSAMERDKRLLTLKFPALVTC